MRRYAAPDGATSLMLSYSMFDHGPHSFCAIFLETNGPSHALANTLLILFIDVEKMFTLSH